MTLELLRRSSSLESSVVEEVSKQVYGSQAVVVLSIDFLGAHFLKLFTNYKFDPSSIKFYIKWVRQHCGESASHEFLNNSLINEVDKMSTTQQLRKTASEMRHRGKGCNLARVQTKQNTVVMHQFDVMKFWDKIGAEISQPIVIDDDL